MRILRVLVLIGGIAGFCNAEFDPSRFNFGADWDFIGKGNQSGSVAQAVDYVTIWLNDPSFNTGWHGTMCKFCKDNNKTPVFYAYIVAKTSKLGDSDVGGKLDAEGGRWLKSNLSAVKAVYENYAQQAASYYGTTKPVIWLMEPDYFQYCNGNDGVSYGEAAGYMSEMISCVKKYLPNAFFSLDISPWNNDQSSYIKAFDMSKFSFMHTSGGRTEAGGDRIRYDNNNNVTWSSVNTISGKCIIADDGYGSGGTSIGHDASWDDLNNLKNRIGNGVVAITQKSPKTDWGNTITSVKSSLSNVSTKCAGLSFKKTYALAITATSGGKVVKSPDVQSYDSGATVTLTATPNSGFKLAGWSGDATGNALSISVAMNKDKNITATFVDVNAKPTYSITLNVTGSGVVKLDPEKIMYDSGTAVGITAYTVNEGTFTAWGGDLSGSNATQMIVMNGNKTVSASFTGDNISLANLIKNGDFSGGDANWIFTSQEAGKATGAVAGGEYKVTHQTSGTAAWHIQLMQPGVSLEKGKKYVLTFYAASPSATEVVVNIGMAADPYTSYSKERKIPFSSTKERKEITFTMNGASTSDARVEFNGGLATSSWTIDDVKLEEAIEIGIVRYVPPINTYSLPFAPEDRVIVSWYNHAGRLLSTTSGNYQSVLKSHGLNCSGSSIVVIINGSRQIVKKTLLLQ